MSECDEVKVTDKVLSRLFCVTCAMDELNLDRWGTPVNLLQPRGLRSRYWGRTEAAVLGLEGSDVRWAAVAGRACQVGECLCVQKADRR